MTQLPAAVFFDWDGTLADSVKFLEDAHSHARKTLGFPPLKAGAFANEYFGQPREKLYKELYAPRVGEAKKTFEAYVRENHLDLKPLPGAEDILKFFAARNIPMGVVSNKKPEFIGQEIKNFGWEKYFKSYVGAAEALQDKPSPEPLLLAIKRARIKNEPKDIWYVGDTEIDLSCARDAGCPALFIGERPGDADLIEKFRPIVAAKNCTELHMFLLQSYGK
jgi:phosphoglycolate phosphatase